MKKHILTVLISIMAITISCQTKKIQTDFNFSFEQHQNGIPIGWSYSNSSNYLIYLDSTIVKEGKYSAVIEYNEGKSEFKSWSFILPENYDGKQITLSGYIKTENVTDGYAGLWMRIDPNIAFDNMGQRGITGSTDWTKYEITLSMNPAKTTQIVFGGLLIGKGKMWLDDLRVSIDGKDIKELKPLKTLKHIKSRNFPADQDREFDTGSNIIFSELNEKAVNDLELLGKIWGFLKYHHPAIGKGKYNWDYELFRILPNYLKTNNIQQRDKILLSWIKKMGNIPVCKTCKETPSDAFLKPNLLWVESSNMSADLKNKIKEIYTNRHQGEHFYIKMVPYRGNPEFLNENSYSNMQYPDAGFRLLSLYRYWNMIHYFFPNTYMTDKNWADVLKEYIPIFISAGNRLEYELAAIQIIGDINDTHANLWGGREKIDSVRGNYYAPFRVQFIEKQLVVTDYYNPEFKKTAGLEIGDIITHINGKSVESIVEEVKKYYPASNEAARLRDISANMLRSNDKNINIQYISSERKKQQELLLYEKDSLDIYHWYKVNKNEKCYKLLNENIGYITLATFKQDDVPKIKELFKNTKGIIMDIRNYPSDFAPFTLGSFFVSRAISFVKFTNGNVNNPGEFTFKYGPIISKAKETYQGKLIVLVNENTQSQAEYTTMAFKAGKNTTVVGSTTAGADGKISTIFLPGGLRTMISGIGIYYPDGKETQRIGIVPDIWIEPTIDGIKNGKDEVLEKAIEVIEK